MITSFDRDFYYLNQSKRLAPYFQYTFKNDQGKWVELKADLVQKFETFESAEIVESDETLAA